MTEIAYIKSHGGQLIPLDGDSLKHAKMGDVVRGKFSVMRNGRFFRKWWKLVEYAYDHWEPAELPCRWGTPEKNKENFRKDLTILAGHYVSYYRVDGSMQVVARSISWASMEEEDFDKFYSATVDAVLKHILTKYTREDLDQVVEQLLLGFG